MAIREELKALNDLIVGEFRKELKDQGHNMTGDLSKSIQLKTKIFPKQVVIEGSFLKYGVFVDQGVKPSRVPFNPGSGKKTSKYIEGLKRFVKLRRIATNNKKALSIAFAIAFKHKKEGIPTKDSKKFSKTGKRLGWVTDTLEENSDTIGELITDIFEGVVSVDIDNLIKRNL